MSDAKAIIGAEIIPNNHSDILERARLVQRVNAHWSDSICDCEECAAERCALLTPMADEIDRLRVIEQTEAAMRRRLEELVTDCERLRSRNKEHEQFRHQHRDCDSMGVELQRLRSRLAEADALIAKGLAVVHDFLPNIGRCVLQDYQRLIEFCSEAAARTAVSAVQPERCCVDYPRCDCNSPPEPDNAPTLQPCGHPWKAQHDFKCILCSSPE